MKRNLLLIVFALPVFLFAQINDPSVKPAGGGEIRFEHNECLSPAARIAIKTQLDENIERLEQAGAFTQLRQSPQIVSFSWPLRQASGFTDPSYYGISNYVDQNTTSGVTQDYNCNTRTYDGHRGTDIFTWPFHWKKMDDNAVEIIAAAPGVIIAKADGYDDHHCACVNYDWNAVYVRHADNSVAWYGHMKKNTTTTKAVGQSVALGEYLGVVGSSGCSTGPHLHFEVYDGSNNLIDPYSGSCNALNASTWWASQKPWNDPTLNKLMLGNAPAVFGDCTTYQDVTNETSSFGYGATMYVSTYLHDEVLGNVKNFTIYRPNNTVWQTWSHNSTNSSPYQASWWYWYMTLPSNNPGTWRVVVTFGTQTVEKTFELLAPVPVELLDFQAVLNKNKTALLTWQTATERNGDYFDIQRSTDGKNFKTIGKVKMMGNTQDKQAYFYEDTEGCVSTTYYRLQQVDKDGQTEISKIVNVTPTGVLKFTLYPMPFSETLHIDYESDEDVSLELTDMQGRVLHKVLLDAQKTVLSLPVSNLPQGIYIAKMKSKNSTLVQKVIKS